MPRAPEPPLPILPGWISRQIEKYIARKSQSTQSFTTGRRNIYILPTKAGFFYTLVLLIILIGAINYNNSLAYLLCFFLGSLGFIDMLQTHQNLKNIRIEPIKISPAFCGEQVHFKLIATSTDSRLHTAIQIQKKEKKSAFYLDKITSTHNFEIQQIASNRGKLAINQFKVFTEFPLGLFHAWSQIKLDAEAIIYPKPVINTHNQTYSDDTDNVSQNLNLISGDEFSGIREHRTSDSPKIMAWKKIAQTGGLYSKNFESEAGNSLIFKLSDITHTQNIELKLSILCQLVIDADKKNLSYGLELGDKTILKAGSGNSHKNHCLMALALY